MLAQFNFLPIAQQQRKRKQDPSEKCGGTPTKRRKSDGGENIPIFVNGSGHAECGPLENHVLLSLIFSFLSPQDLKSCRLVNHFWHQEATPFFFSHSYLEIDHLSLYYGRTAKDFWDKVGNLSTTHLKISKGDLMRDRGLSAILETFGGRVKTLEVDAVAGNDDYEYQHLRKNYFLMIASLCPHLETLLLKDLPECVIDSGFPPLMRGLMVNACPTLRKLSFHCDSHYCGLDAEFLMDLLDWAPKITALHFSVGDDDALEEIFSALEFRPGFMKQVKSLSFAPIFGSTIYESHVQTLVNLELESLEELQIGLLGEDVDSSTLSHLLFNISNNLRILRLGDSEPYSDPFSFKMPIMDKLKEFHYLNMNCLVQLPTCLLTKAPNLIICNLTMSQPTCNPLSISFPDENERRRVELLLRNHNLQQLIFPLEIPYRCIYLLDIIANCFPSLITLKLSIGHSVSCRTVVEVFSNSSIQELHLTLMPEGVAFDSAMTGLTEEECERMEVTESYAIPKNKFRMKTFADWKYLRKLSLISKTPDYHGITGVVAHEGFALASNITCLELGNFKIADTFVLEMLDKMGLTILKLNDCMVSANIWSDSRGLDDTFRLLFPRIHIHCEPPCPPLKPKRSLLEIQSAIKKWNFCL